jgi:signal transduction histidine kinase
VYLISKTAPAGSQTAAGIGFPLRLGGCLLTVAAVVLDFADAARNEPALRLTVHALCVVLPVGLGLFRLAKRKDDRFAILLVAAGLGWSVVTFAQSTNSTLYSVGRVGAWLIEAVIVYLLLAFPDGRLHSRTERRLFGATIALLVGLYLPTALLAQYPEPAPSAICSGDCPSNAFLVTHAAESVVNDVIRPLREVATFLLFAAVAWVLVQRARQGAPLVRRMLVPVAVVAVFRALALGTYDALRTRHHESGAARVVGVIYLLSLALVTISFVIGLLLRRLFVADALQRLTRRLRPHASAADLREALAESLEDPSLEVVYWLRGDPGRWVDETGWPVKAPVADESRVVTEVEAEGLRMAAIVHDRALSQDPALVQAAASYALTALENDRLIGQLRGSLEELSESRARVVAVGDRERRRIERDLHDGAQQRLVALRVRLGLVADRIEGNSPAGAEAVRALEGAVDETLDEVRSFARGIYPALLAERGLSEALRAVGRSAQIPTIVDAAAIGRYAPEVEATVYFACTEALQNAAKHAEGASGVTIVLAHNPHLRFEVSDDGGGFDPRTVAPGAGITNLRDRLAAVGGELHVDSTPGRGTRISGVIPADD